MDIPNDPILLVDYVITSLMRRNCVRCSRQWTTTMTKHRTGSYDEVCMQIFLI